MLRDEIRVQWVNSVLRQGWHGGWCRRHPAHAAARCRGSPESLSVAAQRCAGECAAAPHRPAAQALSTHAHTHRKRGNQPTACTHAAAHTTAIRRADTKSAPLGFAPPGLCVLRNGVLSPALARTDLFTPVTHRPVFPICPKPAPALRAPPSCRRRCRRRLRPRWRLPSGRRAARRTRAGRRR